MAGQVEMRPERESIERESIERETVERETAERESAARTAVDALAQLGWFDRDRRLVVLRLDDEQWQLLQRAVLQGAAAAERFDSTEALLTAGLRCWLEQTG